jgi:hypothetical protein
MKKLFTTLSIILISFTTFSQVCTPDNSITQPGYYPQTLDPAPILKPYEEVIQIRVISDTTVDFNGNMVYAVIDSVKVIKVLGLPSSLTYSCYHPRCVFVSSETRCAKLFGTPQIGEEGTYPIDMVVTVYAKIPSFGNFIVTETDTISNFSLEVYDDGTSVLKYNKHISSKVQVYPNPVKNELTINSTETAFTEIKIRSFDGKVVFQSLFQEKTDLSALPPGLYFIELSGMNGEIYNQKIMIE